MTESTTSTDASVDSGAFVSALASAANSVTIVTTAGTGGRGGLTVSSMCSVCAEPPIVLACVSRDNEFCNSVTENNAFCVNLLNTTQVDIAKVFAGIGPNPDADRFLTGEWDVIKTGSPALMGAVASLDCRLQQSYTHGTHTIYIGLVVGLNHQSAEPLVYHNRAFSRSIPL